MALTVPGGYYSARRSSFQAFSGSEYLPSQQSHLYLPSPARKDGTLSCQVRLIGGQKKGEGWLISVTFIGVVLVAGLLAGTWILECLASPLTANPSRFLPPSKNHVSRRHWVNCAHLAKTFSQQGPQSPPTRELVTGDPMACSILGHPRKHPSGFIAHHQTWQLLPGLKPWLC